MKYNHVQDERFIFLMAALAESCGQESTPFKEKIYAEALSDIPIEQLENAAWELIRDRTLSTFPKVGEIRERLHGKADDLAIIAIDKVQKAMSRFGKYLSVSFRDDPLINAVVSSMGGWIKLCSMEQDEWKWAKKDFEKIYKAFSTRPLEQLQIPEHLPGIVETTNSANGFSTSNQAIVYIGGDKSPLLPPVDHDGMPLIA